MIEGAIISGDLTQKEFKAYIDKYAKSDRIKGVRQVLHVPSAVAGTCLLPEFIENVKYLESKDLVFEGCVRNGELEIYMNWQNNARYNDRIRSYGNC